MIPVICITPGHASQLLFSVAPVLGRTFVFEGVRKAQLVSAKHAIARPLRGRAMACFAGFINWILSIPLKRLGGVHPQLRANFDSLYRISIASPNE